MTSQKETSKVDVMTEKERKKMIKVLPTYFLFKIVCKNLFVRMHRRFYCLCLFGLHARPIGFDPGAADDDEKEKKKKRHQKNRGKECNIGCSFYGQGIFEHLG